MPTSCLLKHPSQEQVEQAIARHNADKNAFLNGTLDPDAGDPFESTWQEYLPLCWCRDCTGDEE